MILISYKSDHLEQKGHREGLQDLPPSWIGLWNLKQSYHLRITYGAEEKRWCEK